MIKKILVLMLALMMVFPASIADQDQEIYYENGCKCICPPNPGPVPYEPRIDVVFAIDSTGSMADEIRTVKTHIKNIVRDVESGSPRPDLRIGLVSYRDHEPEENEYVIRKYRLTDDIDDALDNIERINAKGGGDYPEAVADGLDSGINDMNWDSQAKKIIFLIGDAPPHGIGTKDRSYEQGCPEGHNYKDAIEDAIDEDIVIYTVSGSGMDETGVRVWKDIARKTGGEYKRLTYVRQDLDQYYDEQGIDEKYLAEARTDSDYDESTNSILTNTLGGFAKKALMDEAESIGVNYDKDIEKVDTEVRWLNPSDITGKVITVEEPKKQNNLYGFFQGVFEKITFWD